MLNIIHRHDRSNKLAELNLP